jgi:hypothetical protein
MGTEIGKRARLTPLFEEVEALYDESVERIRHPITGSTCSWPPSRSSEEAVFKWGLCPHTREIFRFAPGFRPAEIDPIPAASRPQNRRSSCVSAVRYQTSSLDKQERNGGLC